MLSFNMHMCSVASVVSDSLWSCGLWPARLFCPWDSPGKNAGVGCHALLQGIFLTRGLNLESLVFPALQADSLPTKLCGKAIYCYILRTWNRTWVISILKLIYFRWSTIPTSDTLKTALRMRRPWLSSWALPCSLPLSGCWPWGRPAAGVEVTLWRGPIRPENSLTSDLGDDLVLVEPSDETLESWLTVWLESHEKAWARGTHLSCTWIPEPQ